jgi:SnoaL-like domain
MSEKDTQWLRDRVEIEKLAFLYAKGNDKSADYYDQCMCDDVEIVYSFGSWKGLAEHKQIRDDTIGVAFTFTQHVITNAIIDIDGDKAKGQYYVYAAHGLPQKSGGYKVICAGAIYTHDVVRTPKGWRIKRHHCETLWSENDAELGSAVKDSFDKRRG